MLRNEFEGSMTRILAFYAKPKDLDGAGQLASYMTSLFESVAWMNAFDFEAVCKRLVQRLNPMKRPMPSEFIERQHQLAKDKAEEAGDKPQRETPEQCLARAFDMANALGSRGACYSYFLMEKMGRKFTPEIQVILASKMGSLEDADVATIKKQVEVGDPFGESLGILKR